MPYSYFFWLGIVLIILISSFIISLSLYYWLRRFSITREMSIWNRKKYTVTVNRRQSSPNQVPEQVVHSNTNSPEPSRRPTLVRSFLTRSANRLSRSLTDLNESSTPPPLPPRRIPNQQAQPVQRPRTTLRHFQEDPENHFQFPPASVIPVLERNASVRNSRLMNTVNPFVFIQFDDRQSSSSELLNRLGQEHVSGSLTRHHFPSNSRRHFQQRHQSLVLPRNFLPSWLQQDEDLPPSYEDAVKMEPAEIQSNDKEITPKRFTKETAV